MIHPPPITLSFSLYGEHASQHLSTSKPSDKEQIRTCTRLATSGTTKSKAGTGRMPRGIPNAKKDETGLRFTSFNVPLGCVFPPVRLSFRTDCIALHLTFLVPRWFVPFARSVFASLDAPVVSLNPKNAGSTYIKSDANTLWTRNAARRAKEPAPVTEVWARLDLLHAESEDVPPHINRYRCACSRGDEGRT